jgi:amidase
MTLGKKSGASAWEDKLAEATIGELQRAMASGELSSRALVLMYMKRIAEIDQAGPRLNAVLELNPGALQHAEAMDAERRRQGPRGPLHGIPVLLKDNIDTADGMHTSAGSLALADHYAANDAALVLRLRAAGAVLLGKANMTEWANFIANGMPAGYSSRGGQVRSPYNDGDCGIGGSSTGSAVAVTAGLTTVAVGTETSGSILEPASWNSVVGVKPTVGLISRSGIVPIAVSQDTAGPIARTVADAAILLGVLAGVDELDPATWASEGLVPDDYAAYLDPNGLRGARIGVPTHFYRFISKPEARLPLFEAALETMRTLGADIVPLPIFPHQDEPHRPEVLTHEFKPCLNAYLNGVEAHLPVHSLRDVIAFNEAHGETMLRYGQARMLAAEATSGTLTDPAYLRARTLDLEQTQAGGIDRVLREHRLDALVSAGSSFSHIPAKAGYPSVTVPGGFSAEGPLGITFTGTAYSEPVLLKLAYAYEQATMLRRAPAFGERG